MGTYLRPGSISYGSIRTDYGQGTLQVADWDDWSTQAAAIATVRGNDGEIIQYIEPPRLTPGLQGSPTASLFFTPPGQAYSLAGWTAGQFLYGGPSGSYSARQRPNPNYPGSYAGDLSARNGLTGTPYMQHIVAKCCQKANDGAWNLDGFFLDSTGNDSMSGPFSGWAAGEAADFNEGGAILTLMLRAALGPDAVIVCNNFFNGNGRGPAAAAAANGICNEHHDDNPLTSWVATFYSRCTNPKRRIIYIPTATGCGPATASAGSLATHICINQPTGASYNNAAAPGTCPSVVNAPWPSDAGHVHLMDSLDWGATPGGATPGGGDTTPPVGVSAFGAGPANGTSVPVSVTVVADADRSALIVARKATAWGGSDNPSAGVIVHTSSPSSGVVAFTDEGVGGGTWYYKPFTQDAAGNVNRSATAVQVDVVTADADPWTIHTFGGGAGTKPDQAAWTDPDQRMPGVTAASTLRLDGSARLTVSALAAAAGVYGSVVLQRRVRLDLGSPARRNLRVPMSLEGPAVGSASFYLVGVNGTGDGGGLSAPFAGQNWLRVELLGPNSVRVSRKVAGAFSTIYSGNLPAVAAGAVRTFDLLIGPADLAVMVDGVVIVARTTSIPNFTASGGDVYLYLEAATSDAAAAAVARWGTITMSRATPSTPTAPTAGNSAGNAVYTAFLPPDEDLVTGYLFTRDGTPVAPVGPRVQTLPGNLPPGEYAITVATANASPWDEATV